MKIHFTIKGKFFISDPKNPNLPEFVFHIVFPRNLDYTDDWELVNNHIDYWQTLPDREPVLSTVGENYAIPNQGVWVQYRQVVTSWRHEIWVDLDLYQGEISNMLDRRINMFVNMALPYTRDRLIDSILNEDTL